MVVEVWPVCFKSPTSHSHRAVYSGCLLTPQLPDRSQHSVWGWFCQGTAQHCLSTSPWRSEARLGV